MPPAYTNTRAHARERAFTSFVTNRKRRSKEVSARRWHFPRCPSLHVALWLRPAEIGGSSFEQSIRRLQMRFKLKILDKGNITDALCQEFPDMHHSEQGEAVLWPSASLPTGWLAMTRAELMRHALSQALRRVHDPARQEAQDRQIAAGRAKLGHPLGFERGFIFLKPTRLFPPPWTYHAPMLSLRYSSPSPCLASWSVGGFPVCLMSDRTPLATR